MMNLVYPKVLAFKLKYPGTVAWRLAAHSMVIERHLNPDEKVLYAFAAQKNDNPLDIITSCVVVLTDRRLLIGQKRVLFGYFFYSITPDMYNDLEVKTGLLWGKLYIDTIKELIVLSNISKRALIEIEQEISEFMITEKKKYPMKKDIFDISDSH